MDGWTFPMYGTYAAREMQWKSGHCSGQVMGWDEIGMDNGEGSRARELPCNQATTRTRTAAAIGLTSWLDSRPSPFNFT